MDNKMKERNCVDKYRSKCKTTRRRVREYKAEKVTTTTTQSESMHMQDGEEPILEFWNTTFYMTFNMALERNKSTIHSLIQITEQIKYSVEKGMY